jgi:hypothetical protein
VTYLDDLRTQASARLDFQSARAAGYQAYYDGDPDVIALLDTEERRTFRRLLKESGANWAELVVNAVAERLQVTGFRFGDGSDTAWLIWQASSMDADSQLVQTDALVCGSSFVLVQPDETNPTGVAITAESPREATVLYQPGNRRRRLAGYKRFADAAGQTTDIIITPDVIATWGPGTGPDGPLIEPNPTGVVCMVEVVPQPRTGGWPRSELSAVIPIQDRIHTLLFNRMVSADYGAFRQIWATGVKMARQVTRTDDGDEKVTMVRPYDVGADRLLINENPEGRFGAFPGDVLGGFLSAVEQDVTMLAAITQTPAHYLTGTVANLSADAIKAAEVGLVSKIRRRAVYIGEAYEEVQRIALGLVGDPAAADVEAEVIWADPETRSMGQLVDALVKLATLGIPRRVLWELYGASPQQVDRWLALGAAEAPEPAPPPAPPVPQPAPEPPA